MGKLVQFVVGFGVGAAAGFITTRLLTPSSSEDLQAGVRHRVETAIEEGKRAGAAQEEALKAQFAQEKHL